MSPLGAEYQTVAEAQSLLLVGNSALVGLEDYSDNRFPFYRSRFWIRPDLIAAVFVHTDKSAIAPSTVRIEVISHLRRHYRNLLGLDLYLTAGLQSVHAYADSASALFLSSQLNAYLIVILYGIYHFVADNFLIITSPFEVLVADIFRQDRSVKQETFSFHQAEAAFVQAQALCLNHSHADFAYGAYLSATGPYLGLALGEGADLSVVHHGHPFIARAPLYLGICGIGWLHP